MQTLKIARPVEASSPVHCYRRIRLYVGVFLALVWLALSAVQAQTTNYTLGTSALLVGPSAGTNSVVLAVTPSTATWTATTNGSWLHLTPADEVGTGSTNVVFTYDANPGQTRSGTLTIAGQTLTVTQAGSSYVAAAPVTTLVSSGLYQPFGVAVDGSGNVYIVNTDSNEIQEWVAAQNAVIALVSSGLVYPHGVAVDGSGNVYIAGYYDEAIKEWTAANDKVTTLLSVPAYLPLTVAVDLAGSVYFTTTDSSAVFKLTEPANTETTVVSIPELVEPVAVAVDAAENLYIADTSFNTIKTWTAANGIVTALVSSGLNGVSGVAVDGSGNVYIADTGNNAIKEWTAANNNVATLVSSGLNHPTGVAVDEAGNVYIADYDNNAIKELTYAFIVPTLKSEGLAAGNDSLPAVLPATAILPAPFTPTSDQPWLTISGITNGVVSFSFATNLGPSRTAQIALLGQTIPIVQGAGPYTLLTTTISVGPLADTNGVVLAGTSQTAMWTAVANAAWLHVSPATQSGVGGTNVVFSYDANPGSNRIGTLTVADQTLTVTQAGPTFSLGTTALLEGPAGGRNSVVLAVNPNFGVWTATTNAVWLHLSQSNQSGTGSTNLIFSYDANPGPTRSGTLTVAGDTLTVTQAGSNYVSDELVTTLVSSNLNNPRSLAVDGAGNVYVADTGNNAIKEWMVANNTVATLVSSGLSQPKGVAVDSLGNVYIADTGNNAIKEWSPANSNVTTLVSGLNGPSGVAVDAMGNLYIADTSNNVIEEWTAANTNLTTLVAGLNVPSGVAVDVAGNVYFADTSNNAIKEWTVANSNVTTLVSDANAPFGVAVDGAGNVYIADAGSNAVEEWTAATSNVTTLVSGLNSAFGVAVDKAGNIDIADTGNSAIKELPNAFVNPANRSEGANAGNDVLPVVLPVTANLLAPFSPTSDQPWLAITGITNGVVNFSFAANLGPARAAHINLLGQVISITQSGSNYSLGTTALLVGPSVGRGSVVLSFVPATGWTASTNATWLHLSLANQQGAGSTNLIFSYDANPGATRSGTLTIAGQTLTVTQAGSTYTPARIVTTLVSNGVAAPSGVAVDASGNVYIADTGDSAIKKWTAANNAVTTLVSSGLVAPVNVRLDGAGNVYWADYILGAILEWTVANSNLTTLVSSGLDQPLAVALDGAGNVYIADSENNAVKVWSVANSNVTTLVSSGLNLPDGVAVDGAGNVYIADFYNSALKKWAVASNTVTTLVSGVSGPSGVVVDGSGNVYIAADGQNAILRWTAASNATILVASGLSQPQDVAVDTTGNVYIADSFHNAIKELTYAFIDATPKPESAAAGTDALPMVLPITENLLPPFAPTSDQAWLAITGITNGVVSFSFTFNPVSSRTAHITLLGQSISVTQAGAGVTPPALTGPLMLGGGLFQFSFTNVPGASFTVLSATNLSMPLSNWTVVGAASNMGGGQFQFTLQTATNIPQSFYTVRSP
jgi:DNA-binding beta-propeller fold protein YncE